MVMTITSGHDAATTHIHTYDPDVPDEEFSNCFDCAAESGKNRICHKVERMEWLEAEG